MATPFLSVYEAFLSGITADEWSVEEDRKIVEEDWKQLLYKALVRFKYPRVSLEIDEEKDGFVETLSIHEIQLLGLYMKHEWVDRCIASWENIRQLYTDKDFSQANHLDKLIKMEERLAWKVREAEGRYDRSRNYRPASIFSKLAGRNKS